MLEIEFPCRYNIDFGIAKVIFHTPPWSVFGQLFVIFSFFRGLEVFVKIEPPPRRELNFEGPGPSKCHFFSPGAPSKNEIDFGGSCLGGRGTPRENLSGLAGPPLVSKMLIGTGTAMRPKRTTPAGGLGAKLEAVGKKP